MTPRVVVICPGRGSYAASELGSLTGLDAHPRATALRELLAVEDARRHESGDPGVREMDAASSFRSAYLRGENAAPLIFAVGVFDALRIDPERARVVAVAGNSMGWYTALHCAGAIDLDAAWRLVTTMGERTRSGTIGGQIVYPVVGEDWRADADRAARVRAALARVAAAGGEAGLSIRYGGLAVLWASEPSLEKLQAMLPEVQLGRRSYPLRLLGNSAFHSPLMREGLARVRATLADLPITAPRVPLVDGRGVQWRPLTTDAADLFDDTLDRQVTETYDFAASVRVALREYAPDHLVLLGPGDTLGSAVAQVLIAERWQGIDSREAFLERQRADPLVLSMARSEQAALLT
jgi:malonyl CoA-acyl carrier protein transacylase